MKNTRLPFIDFGRGIAMLLMAWDHVSAFWNPGRRGSEGLMGLRPDFPDTTQFLLRFVTHFVAPTFVFLAGTSLALSVARRLARGDSQRSVSLHLVVRGAILLALEVALVSTAFELPPLYFGVIACIGLCLILFAGLRLLPAPALLLLSLTILLGASFVDLSFIPDGPGSPIGHYLHVILYQPRWDFEPYVGLYPIIPWLGVMGLGWCFGLYLNGFDWAGKRRLALRLAAVGVACYVVWFVVRLTNGYGNLLARQGNTLVDWLYVSKYPPSLAFLLFTLGGMSLYLALGVVLQDRPNFQRGVSGAIVTIGSVPLFFYLAHLWLYKLGPRPLAGAFDDMFLATGVFYFVGLPILWAACVGYRKLKRRYPRSILQYI